MSQLDPELFEKELRKLEPAGAPKELTHRIGEAALAVPSTRRFREEAKKGYQTSAWWQRLRWLAPATAATAVLLSLLAHKPETQPQDHSESATVIDLPKPMLKANMVEIDEHLVASFDAVARLPDGAPVRLRCREWRDEMVLRDSARGITIERQSPRFEIIPVRYDVY